MSGVCGRLLFLYVTAAHGRRRDGSWRWWSLCTICFLFSAFGRVASRWRFLCFFRPIYFSKSCCPRTPVQEFHQVTITLRTSSAVLAIGELWTHGTGLVNDSVCSTAQKEAALLGRQTVTLIKRKPFKPSGLMPSTL